MNVTIEADAEGDCAGGAMAVVDGTSAPPQDRGGFAYMTGGTLKLESVVVQNFQESTRGGAVALRGAGDVTLELSRCRFSNCEASWYGGAVYAYGADGDVEGESHLLVRDTTFENCTAFYNGGGVHMNGLYGNLTASFADTIWRNNYATDGAGMANLFGKIACDGCVMEDNTAGHQGGGKSRDRRRL